MKKSVITIYRFNEIIINILMPFFILVFLKMLRAHMTVQKTLESKTILNKKNVIGMLYLISSYTREIQQEK